MKNYVKQGVIPGGNQKGQAAHDLNFISKYKKDVEKIIKKCAVFNMSYRVEQLVLWEITVVSLDTTISYQNTAGVFIFF